MIEPLLSEAPPDRAEVGELQPVVDRSVWRVQLDDLEVPLRYRHDSYH